MKKFNYKNLKLFLYLCILLFIINCTFNNDDSSNIDIIEISQEINNSIIYKNDNGDLNIFNEDGNNIVFAKADVNTKYYWPTISMDNNFISYSYVTEQIIDYKIGIKILDILNNNTYEIYSEINPIKNVLSNDIPHYMAWSLIDNILSFVVPTENYPALFIHKTSNINNVNKLVENGPIWLNWNENNQLSVHRRSKRLIFNINNSITNLINTNDVSPFYRLDAWGSLDATSNDIYSVFQNDAKFKHIIKSDILNNTFEFINSSEDYPLINISPDKLYLSVLKSKIHPTALYDSFILYKTKNMSEKIIEITNAPLGYFWSPDSSKIALFTANQNNGYYDLYILNIENLELKKIFTLKLSTEQLEMIIFSDQFAQSHNLWSPDSSKLLLSGNLYFNNIDDEILDKNPNIILISDLDSNPKSEILFDGSIAYWTN